VVRRDPRQFGHPQSRWTLRTIAQSCGWLQVTTEGGLSQVLKRLGISYKRARDYVHSPDPHYMDKLSLIELRRLRALYEPETYVFLYLDEFSYYRQPSLARAYEATGHEQPLAQRSYRPNTRFRGIGALNAITGQVTYRQRSKINLPTLAAFLTTIRLDYPDAEEIYIVLDNWPVHFHPDVLVYLQPQDFPWPPRMPPTWPTTSAIQPDGEPLPIQFLCLPTYASWLNPIEKLWRWLKQDVLHLHRLSNDWQVLKQLVLDFFDPFCDGSTELLTYVGLLPN
jgi:DDE superfamily endonuclease